MPSTVVRSTRRRAAPAALALALLLPAAARAQEPAAKTQVLSVNPLALVFAGLSGEYERRTGDATAFALGASVWGDEGLDYVSGDLKFRFYPSGEALRGFSVAGTAGYARVNEEMFLDDCLFDCVDDGGDAVTAGVELNYQWLLGRTRSFAMTAGLGAKRFFYVSGGGDDASRGLPTARFSIGYAF